MAEEFPANSRASKEQPTAPPGKKVESVVTGNVRRQKKSLGKSFKGLFFGGDAKSAARSVVMETLLPAAQDMISDGGREMIDRIIYGESRRGPSRPRHGGGGSWTAYNRPGAPVISGTPDNRRPELSRRARTQHDFDEIVIETRVEAEAVLDRMYDLLNQFEVVTVGDLLDLVDITSTHVDQKWGWTSLKGATFSRARGGGYLLNLPPTEPIK